MADEGEEYRGEWRERVKDEERARVQAQKFQAGQNTRLIRVAEHSATAAKWAAIATIVIAGLTVFLVWAAFKAID